MSAIETFGMIIQFVSLPNRPPKPQVKILSSLIKMAALNPLQPSCISEVLVHISNALGDCINTMTTLLGVLRDWRKEQCPSSADKGEEGEFIPLSIGGKFWISLA